MPAPFYNAIKGTTAGTPGTGAFTPNAASSGFLAWSTLPTGWIGVVRYEDGSAWELQYSYWNGTTLSRATTQFVSSSTGSALTLTSAATAALVIDASDVMSHVGTTSWRGYFAIPGSASTAGVAVPAITITGTAAGVSVASTNFLTQQPHVQSTSATTANAQAGFSYTAAFALVSTTAGMGGFDFVTRFGASQLPTGPRLFAGMTGTTFVANTGEPSALTASFAAFAKDSTDTNIQLLVNSNVGSGTKTDTGIPLTANGWYEMALWCEPGSNKAYGLLIRLDTGAIWLGSTTTDVPADGTVLFPQVMGGLSSTTGTAFIMQMGSITVRSGV
jgi:hypothetical protein